MKGHFTLMSVAAIMTISLPSAAQAQEESRVHPFIGAQIGHHDLGLPSDLIFPPNITLDDNGMIYGVYAGADFDIGGNFVLGAEGNFNLGNGAIDSEYGAAARFGYRTQGGTTVYGRIGYQWVDIDVIALTGDPSAGISDTDDDLLVGVGADIALGKAHLRLAVDTIAFDSLRPTVGLGLSF